MLTSKDIKILSDFFNTKEEFGNFREELKKEFSDLHTAIDGYAKKADAYFEEMVTLSHKVDRQEKWIHEIAEKIGMNLKY